MTNTGNVTLTSVGLLDDIEGGITLSVTSLAPGASATGASTHTLAQVEIESGSLTNTAKATATSTAEAPTPATNDATVNLTQNPSIQVDKAFVSNDDDDLSGDVSLGDTLNYRYTVTNTGNLTLINLTLVDYVEGAIALTGLTDEDGDTITDDLAPGAFATGSVTHTVTQADVDAGKAVNTATPTGTPPAGPDETDTSTVDVPVTHLAWTLTKVSVVTQVTSTVTNIASVSAGNSIATGGTSATDTVVVATDITTLHHDIQHRERQCFGSYGGGQPTRQVNDNRHFRRWVRRG